MVSKKALAGVARSSVKPDKRYGTLVVESYDFERRKWSCKCDCGNTRYFRSGTLTSGHNKSCGCAASQLKSDAKFKGCGNLPLSVFNAIIRHTKRYGRIIPFSLKIEDVWSLFERQNSKCALSGLPITLKRRRRDKQTASLDRIDSSVGYELSNIQWVHKVVQRMKNAIPQCDFISWCRKVKECRGKTVS